MDSEVIKLMEEQVKKANRELDDLTDEKEREAKIKEIERLSDALSKLQKVASDDNDKFNNFSVKVEEMERAQKREKWELGLKIVGVATPIVFGTASLVLDSKGVIQIGPLKDTVKSFFPRHKG